MPLAQTPTAAEPPRHTKYERLIAEARALPPLCVAVAHPCDDASLGAALDAHALGLIMPILVGPQAKIAAAAEKLGADLSAFRIVDAAHSDDSAAKAVALVRAGEADALMKGSLHTDELMAAVVARDTGLRTKRRISHCFLMDVPSHPEPLIITDAAVNIAPDLIQKRDIVQKRHRPGQCAAVPGGTGRHPLRHGDGQSRGALHHRGGGALQDGGSRTDHGRHRRRAACPR